MIAYILKSSVSLIVLFGLYWFLLRKEKLFVFNRYFLLTSVVFSLIVPFISIPVNFQITPQLNEIIPAYNYVTPENSIADNVAPNDVNISQLYVEKKISVISIPAILLTLYFSGVILFLIRFLRNIYLIIRRSKLSEKISSKGYQIVLTNDKMAPCCFFSNLFLNKDDYMNGKIDKELLNHELEHVRQSHSIDIILIELVKIFYWFNPVYILYDRAIRINHEYLADNGVINDNSDIKSYADKLLSFITGRSNMSLTSGSNNSFTKMRLMMMMKPGSRRFIYGARIALTICIGIVFSLLLSFKESDKQPLQPNLSGMGTEVTQSIVRGIVLNEEGKPLKEATIVCMTSKHASSGMTIGSDGRFAINNVQADYSLIIGCLGYKTQIIEPDFTSEMIIKLTKDPNSPEIKDIYFRNPDFTRTSALVAINGMILESKDPLRVKPREIESYKILKDKEATDKYGDKGKDGVLEIVLYDNFPGSVGKKRANGVTSDTSKYITLLSVNHVSNKGELIDIPVSNLQSASMWTFHDTPTKNKKELRFIGFMTRDYYKVKGNVVGENGKPLSGVGISVSENPISLITDNEGRFVIEDVWEDTSIEFSLPGFKPYILATKFGAAFTIELTIQLEKDEDYIDQGITGKQSINSINLNDSNNEDTLNPYIYHANTATSDNKKIILKGNVVITIFDSKNRNNNIKADSAIFDKDKNIIKAYNGTMVTYNSGENDQIESFSFKELNYDMTSRKVLVKDIVAIDKVSAGEKPELFPVKNGDYSEMTRTFGEKYTNIVTKAQTVHYGIDIKTEMGTDVIATAGGIVIYASWDGGFGNTVVIDHGDGYQSKYAHLKDIIVKDRDTLKKGQTIGHVGSSGISTGPHLHFEISLNGNRVNPMKYLK